MSFECGLCDGPLKTSLMTMREILKSSRCLEQKFDLGRDCRCERELNDDRSLHDLAVIHNLLALRIVKQVETQPTEPSERKSPNDQISTTNAARWMEAKRRRANRKLPKSTPLQICSLNLIKNKYQDLR